VSAHKQDRRVDSGGG